LGRAARQGCAHAGEGRDEVIVFARVEGARRALNGASFELSSFGFPFRQTAVEDEHVLGPEEAKRPPHPWRGKQAGTVVDDDGVRVGDAEGADVAGKLAGVRQHMR
jgi:hypothetical protein